MVAETATGLRRGLAILFALDRDEASANGGLSVTRVAQLVGREKSQVSRTLKTLLEHGLVDRDPDTLGYRLGWRLFVLAGRAGDPNLVAAAGPLLSRLVQELGETAHLSMLQGTEVMTILTESPGHAVQAAGRVGRTVPVYCTSSGRALLFDHDLAQLRALLDGVELRALGPNAPRRVDELSRRVEAARARGYALIDEEFETGLVAVAAPVRDFSGRIAAAVNVSAPKFRFGERLEAAGLRVKSAADELSAALGWRAEASTGNAA